eukprot:gene25704-22198_t
MVREFYEHEALVAAGTGAPGGIGTGDAGGEGDGGGVGGSSGGSGDVES